MSSTQTATLAGVDFENTSPADLAKMIAEMTAIKNKAETELKAAQEKALRDAVEGVVHYAIDHTEYQDYGQNGNIWAGYKLGPVQFKVGDRTYTVSVSVTDVKRKAENVAAKAEREAAGNGDSSTES